MAIRRSIVSPHLAFLDSLSRSEDSFFFYAGLMAGTIVLLEETPLTQYRIHSRNESRFEMGSKAERLAKFARHTGQLVDATLEIRGLIRGSNRADLLRLIDRDVEFLRLLNSVQRSDSSRRSILKRLMTFLPLSGLSDLGGDSALVGLAAASLLSPTLGSQIYLGMRR